ncbi:MAG: hypothetical protein IT433_03275 [Phycisphaerales bacterium]|nr:hypothetical protein [Phycisphaerales bacterium]
MKYCMFILAGAPDDPLDALDGGTPLERIAPGAIAALAGAGRIGIASTTPDAMDPGPDTGTLSLLGYDPRDGHPGRAALEALAAGLAPEPQERVARLSLLSVGPAERGRPGAVLSAAPATSPEEAAALIDAILASWRDLEPKPSWSRLLEHGSSWALLAEPDGGPPLAVTAPWFLVGAPWRQHVPRGRTSEHKRLSRRLEAAALALSEHPVNAARAEEGLPPINAAWLWGWGRLGSVQPFDERFGIGAAFLSTSPLPAAIGAWLGMENHVLPFEALAHEAIACLRTCNLVIVHVSEPHECAVHGDAPGKVAALEKIDRELIAPVYASLSQEYGDPESHPGLPGWRLLVTSDHATPCDLRRPDPGMVPVLLAGAWVRSLVQRGFTEAAAQESDLVIDPGHTLMEFFLRGGLAKVRGR